MSPNGWLFNVLDGRRVRHDHGVIQDVLDAVGGEDLVNDRRVSRKNVEIVLAAQTLLNDFHVQETQEAATETKAQGRRTFRGIRQRGIVNRQFRQGGLQLFVICRVEGIDAAEYHWADFLKARDRLFGRICRQGDGIADFHVGDFPDIDDDITHRSGAKFVLRLHLRRKNPHFFDDRTHPVIHEFDGLAGLECARENTDVTDDAFIRIEQRIEDQRAMMRIFGPARRRHALDNRRENFVDTDAGFTRSQDRVLSWDGQNIFDLTPGLFGTGAGQVDLVNDRNNLQPLVHR